MALILCPECGNTISDRADACPHCGYSTEPQHITLAAVDLPFGNLVGLMVKWALASIPAILILSIISALAVMLVVALAGGAAATLFTH